MKWKKEYQSLKTGLSKYVQIEVKGKKGRMESTKELWDTTNIHIIIISKGE